MSEISWGEVEICSRLESYLTSKLSKIKGYENLYVELEAEIEDLKNMQKMDRLIIKITNEHEKVVKLPKDELIRLQYKLQDKRSIPDVYRRLESAVQRNNPSVLEDRFEVPEVLGAGSPIFAFSIAVVFTMVLVLIAMFTILK